MHFKMHARHYVPTALCPSPGTTLAPGGGQAPLTPPPPPTPGCPPPPRPRLVACRRLPRRPQRGGARPGRPHAGSSGARHGTSGGLLRVQVRAGPGHGGARLAGEVPEPGACVGGPGSEWEWELSAGWGPSVEASGQPTRAMTGWVRARTNGCCAILVRRPTGACRTCSCAWLGRE